MIPREDLYLGDLNGRALEPQRRGPVGLYDTTLRDGEQAVGVALDPEQKLEIARLLDGLGIERIEAGFPRVSADDARAIELIAGAGLSAEIWGFSRAVQADVEALVELGLTSSVIEAPLSDLKLKAYGVDRDEMLERIRKAVSFAAEHGITVAYFGVDGRAPTSTSSSARTTARRGGRARGRRRRHARHRDAGGGRVPRRARVGWVDVPIHWHGHNDFGLATAAAVAAVQAGATWIHGTINGMGERAGNASLAEVALALERALRDQHEPAARPRARGVARACASSSGYELEPWKPLVGETLFRRESGAVASQFHDPPSIEPYAAALVGASDRSCSARSPASTRSGSSARSSASRFRPSSTRNCSHG
jgi:isopropylmalate/homocitrate/citramalate synthase